MTIKTQDRVISYIQPEGRGTPLEPMSIDRHGLGDQTDNTIPGRGVLFGRDEFGRPTPKVEFDEAPSGLNTATVTFDPEADPDFLDTMRLENGKFGVWSFFIPAGRLGNYANWTNNGSVDFLAGAKISAGNKGGREKDYSGQPLANTYDLSWRETISLLPPKLTNSSPGVALEPENINSVAFLSDLDPNQDIPGYVGRDKHGFAAAADDGAAAANILYTLNGGGSWAVFGALPFAVIEGADFAMVRFITHDTYRLVVGRTTVDATAAAEIGYTDIVLGGEAASPTWINVDIGVTTSDILTAAFWPKYNRMYAAITGGGIWVSTDQSESWIAIGAAGATVNGFAMDFDENIYAVGASNAILREKSSDRGVFDALVGPSGGTEIFSVAAARDGYLYAGVDTKIYRSNNLAANVGGWTELKDFGVNHSVIGIQCIGGESQIMRVLVSDITGTNGDVWYSLDGGNSFVEVTDLGNLNYNGWYISEVDPNLLFVAGDTDSGGAGVIHKLSGV